MHWKEPTVLVSAFVVGLAFAIGHHYFYRSLEGMPVDGVMFRQQINLGVGTAFAFLVRACLVLAIGTTCAQLLWRHLLHRDVAVKRIDSLNQVLSSLIDLFNPKTMKEAPLLVFLAFVSWTIPFAAIVPPATLTVRVIDTPVSTRTKLHLPQIDFNNSGYAIRYSANIEIPTISQDYYFGGSTDAMYQMALGTAISAQIPTIQAPGLNSSYQTQFYGPAVKCKPTDSQVVQDFDTIFGCPFYNGTRNVTHPCSFGYTYLAWVPNPYERVPGILAPAGVNTSTGIGYLNFIPQYSGSDYGLTTTGGFLGEPDMVYIATPGPAGVGSWSVLNCSLFNASYESVFGYNNGSQTINTTIETVNSIQFINFVDEQSIANVSGYPPVGAWYNRTDTRAVNYQAVMDAFGKIVVGGLQYSISRVGGGTNTLATSIMTTDLRKSPELSRTTGTRPLAEGLEELFQNITLSLFSKSDYVGTEMPGFQLTEVTLFSYPNVYNYNWRNLVLAYGVAILFAAIAVFIGGWAFWMSGRSYSSTFSTIVRTTRQPIFDELVEHDERYGESPLPKHVGNTRVRVGWSTDTNDKMQPAPISSQAPSRNVSAGEANTSSLRRGGEASSMLSSVSSVSRHGQ